MVFEQTYHAARQAFRLEAKQMGAVLDSVTLEADGQRAEDGSELTIDFASWGEGERCVVMSSGLHGVEGYIGSATQRLLMASKPPAGRRYLLIHAINPWGMVQFRRVNAFNVDLNRNFLPPGEPYSGSPDHYERLDGLLNPKRSFSQLEFLARSGWQILRHGYEPLKQAIAGGQYDYEKGLFWGGDRQQEGSHKLLEAIPKFLEDVEDIIWIDVHSGLGPCGRLTYLLEASTDAVVSQRLSAHFGEQVQAWDQQGGVAYAIRGGFPAALKRMFGDRLAMLTCEYGTQPSVEILRLLVLENQIVNFGGDRVRAKAAMRRAFYPADSDWQNKAHGSAEELIQALATY